MTRFLDGPAAGITLALRRAPLFLRVVRSEGGKFDALDQLRDSPHPTETIFVYRRKGEARVMHLDYTDKKTRRRRGTWYTTAEYEHYPQPGDDVLRDTAAWRAWCVERVKTEVTPAAADLARRAWDAMLRKPRPVFDALLGVAGPMPPVVALDMVQDESGDRQAAKVAIEAEARKRIRELFREQAERDRDRAKKIEPFAGDWHLDELHVLGSYLSQILSTGDQTQVMVSRIFAICQFPDPRRDSLARLETYRLAGVEADRILALLRVCQSE